MKFGDLVKRKQKFYDSRVHYPGGFDIVGVVASKSTVCTHCFVKVLLDNKFKTLTVQKKYWEVVSESR